MRAERGFILATTLLVMTVLTVMLAAAFVMISAEFRTTNGSYGSTRALNVAQAGLQSYFAAPHNLAAGYDSTNYTFKGGLARVVARKLRDSTTSARQLWVVYSTGIDTTNRTNAGSAGSLRVVAQLAGLTSSALPHKAALIAANGVSISGPPGNPNPINGVTLQSGAVPGCNDPGGAAYDTIGLVTSFYPSGTGSPPSGEGTNGMLVLPSSQDVIDSTHIDWAKVLAGQFTPDFYGTLPPICTGTCAYQSYYWTTDVTVPAGQRRGLLVSAGDVTLASNAHWDGVIIAGGKVDTPNGASTLYWVHGMVITGLNGGSAHTSLFRSTNGQIRWDYCYATASISSLSSLTPVRGAYADSWKTW